MGELERTKVESVEKTETVTVCDSCGTPADELPDNAGEYREVWLDVGVQKQRPDVDEDRMKFRVQRRGRRSGTMPVYVSGEKRDLCPVCWGVLFE